MSRMTCRAMSLDGRAGGEPPDDGSRAIPLGWADMKPEDRDVHVKSIAALIIAAAGPGLREDGLTERPHVPTRSSIVGGRPRDGWTTKNCSTH
jgi:hypothetical protein